MSYQQFIAVYVGGCQICCNFSRLKPDFHVPAHESTMLQIYNDTPPSHFKLTLDQPALF